MPRETEQPDSTLPARVDQKPGHSEIIGETFPSRKFHGVIQRAPLQKRNSQIKRLYISRSHDGRWYVQLTGRKFAAINDLTCIDVTEFNRNYQLLN